MKTIIKDAIWDILGLFYNNKNQPLHLREISRKIKLNESPLTRHLNYLTHETILRFEEEGNLKKFYINNKFIPEIFPLYDQEKIRNLPLIRRKALDYYLQTMDKKPIFLILFGSTAKGTFKKDSDIDLIEIFNEKTDTKNPAKFAEAQTGMRINSVQMTFKKFMEEIKLKNDPVIQSALETGFPIYNHKYFYEAVKYERI